ncbi:MAG: hypothetical protein MI810_10265, partial [Flavobacteriales bacterium]|nr:hypothetical protein [Flavobacteriales bacterium]
IDKPWDSGDDFQNLDMVLTLTTINENGLQQKRLLKIDNDGGVSPVIATSYSAGAYTKLEGFDLKDLSVSSDYSYLPAGASLRGTVTTYRQDVINLTYGVDSLYLVNEAHTGKQSLEIDGDAEFTHGNLVLEKDKEYIMSCWVKVRNTNAHTYDGLTIGVEGDNGSGVFSDISTKTTYGKMVEGWQKVDVEFTPTIDYQQIRTLFHSDGTEKLYLDDVRIAPKLGGIQTYVYDTENFRLVATLNENNFATLFFYDEQGNLYLKKQETEEGIITLSANHSYLKPN